MPLGKLDLQQMFSMPQSFGIEAGVEKFPDQSQTSAAVNFARYVRRILGEEARIVGYWHADNPHAIKHDRATGHDFIIFQNRYLIDASLSLDEGAREFAVLDLFQPMDAEIAIQRHGDVSTWEFSENAEHQIDIEDEDARQTALIGTVFGSEIEMSMSMGQMP